MSYHFLEKTRRSRPVKLTSLPVMLVLFALAMTLSSVGFVLLLGTMK